ncbi:PREDICTED: DDT domain-containing protein PTM-like isoform X2 [Ipomoea nil]|uniref:DDT domain-containing protein PTM-like isoform X2 n=1 Tax=Ipomoea nil TaxID=35883 RepID=UPI000901550E|nr:PREDICTED: DDT domain-containing protein PTM-like isoform X2 [Ipomoea nil]
MEEYLGRTVKKKFKRFGVFTGTVESYDSESGFFKIVYEDGDSEELDLSELVDLLDGSAADAERSRKPSRVGRKPKKRRRVEKMGNAAAIDGGEGLNSGGIISEGFGKTLNENGGLNLDLNDGFNLNDDNAVRGVDLSVNLNGGLDLDKGVELSIGDDLNNVNKILNRNNGIDLNMDANGEANINFEKHDSLGHVSQVIEANTPTFDLNLGMNEETKNVDTECDVKLMGTPFSQPDEEIQNNENGLLAEGLCCSNVEKTPENLCSGLIKNRVDDGSLEGVDIQFGDTPILRADLGSGACSSVQKGRRGRKKRRLSDTPNGMTETVLRRSTRRARKEAMSSQDNIPQPVVSDVVSDPLSSPALSVVSDEKVHEVPDDQNALPPKPELPPSSNHLDLNGISVPDIFSLYAFLRSFSSLLFLSPFELENFVASIKCSTPTLLFDSIHVSLLQMLRKHLESLSSEGSESASNCLRSLNWDLLDLITWPIFMVEYMLMHSSGLRPGFDICQLKLFECDYYKQPTSVKIEMLRCLCDDVMEIEAITSELNRRTAVIETNNDFDQNMKLDILKKRRAATDVVAGSCLTEELVDETADWNSDECCLCKMDGNLICCDGCPAAFHSKCVGIASSLLPEGDWFCPECIIDRKFPWMKVGKSIRGAELLGMDPYGRLYFNCCGYLLVSDSWDDESSFKYYYRNDLPFVVRALKSSEIVYHTLLTSISKIWDASSTIDGAKSDMDSQPTAICRDIPAIAVQHGNERSNEGNHVGMAMTSPSSTDLGCEKSETVNPLTDMENLQKNVNEPKSLGKESSRLNSRAIMSEQQCLDTYVNFYSFARSASAVVEELTRKPSDKSTGHIFKSEEELISFQLKAISNNPTDFCWPNIHNLNVGSTKEKCGWCFPCRVPECELDCLFIMNDTGPDPKRFSSEALGVSSRKNRKGHLIDVICHILCIEKRLLGLLLGPWLNPMHSQIWQKSVLKASDVSSLRFSLLKLESNLRHLALSADWLKHVDSLSTLGSACHIVTRVSSRHGIGKKKVRRSELESNSNPSSNAGSGLGLLWWRGGRISRQIFSWKVLPRPLACKAARQGGCKKIPGILYPDGSEFAKRSKSVAWRAAVETSRSVEQLALQIRDLDANIRWNDIGNVNILSMIDKESQKSIRFFKKVIIRRKCSEGPVVKYLLDFGKRRFIPDVVVKYGSKLEDSSSERKRYWLEETYVPLHLLKAFEAKRIARKSSMMSSPKQRENKKIIKKPIKNKGFSYLFEKAEKAESYQCGHCDKDVLISEAVSCCYCKGFFHRRHVKKSGAAFASECIFTCHKCQDGKHVKNNAKKGKSVVKKSKKTSKILRTVCPRTKKRGTKDKQQAQSQNNTKVPVGVPLRRSARRAKIVQVQEKKANKKVGRPRRKKMKSRKGTTKKPTEIVSQKKRTKVYHIYWLNGLLLSQKPNDERVALFRSKNLLVLSSELDATIDSPKCSLCSELESTPTVNYIACELCGDWFHGDAFGLTCERICSLIGFKCHKCLSKSAPVCSSTPMIRSGEAKLAELKSDDEIECANDMHLEERIHSHTHSKESSLTAYNDEKQSLEDIHDSGSGETRSVPVGVEWCTEAKDHDSDSGETRTLHVGLETCTEAKHRDLDSGETRNLPLGGVEQCTEAKDHDSDSGETRNLPLGVEQCTEAKDHDSDSGEIRSLPVGVEQCTEAKDCSSKLDVEVQEDPLPLTKDFADSSKMDIDVEACTEAKDSSSKLDIEVQEDPIPLTKDFENSSKMDIDVEACTEAKDSSSKLDIEVQEEPVPLTKDFENPSKMDIDVQEHQAPGFVN